MPALDDIRKRLEKVFGKRQSAALAEVFVEIFGELARTADLDEVKAALRDLAEAQSRTEQAVGRLAEAQARAEERLGRVEGALERLAEAQRETERELGRLISWQLGEDGRRRGERYEREILRRAVALFNGGEGGVAEEAWVRNRLAEGLKSVLEGMLEVENDPFLADLIWWKGNRIAVVEASIQVNGEDVARAAGRAGALKQAGLRALAVVIGEKWATVEARQKALAGQVEWKVGSDLSEGFVEFRQAA